MAKVNPTSNIRDFTASAGVVADQPASAPDEITARAVTDAHPALTAPVKRGSIALAAGIVGVVVLAILALLVIVYLVAGLGTNAFALGGIMALVPFAVVFFAVRVIDRWEPEPRLAAVFAFLWGSAAAVVIALVVGAEIDSVVNSLGGPGTSYEFFQTVIQAPIVEEVAKGLGVLILFWVARRQFDGPVDGFVYAAWVAGGFAFTENILYFGSQLVESGGVDSSVLETFLIRGIMSPFAHVMFTACTGIALGFAARRAGAFGALGFFVVGLVPAIFLHALWNGALFFVTNFYVYFVIIQVPLFVGAILFVRTLRRQEAKLTYDRLTEYAAVGWFAPAEISSIATPEGRRSALAWANANGSGGAMRNYIRDATKLAFARQRIITGRGRSRAEADEAVLLVSLVESREALTAPR